MFSHDFDEPVPGQQFHRCFLKAAFTNTTCNPYTNWTGSTGPGTCPGGGALCILSCRDYGGFGAEAECGVAEVVGLVLNKKDWKAEPVRWTASFDPRQRSWYQEAKHAVGLPSDDPHGGCAAAASSAANGTLERWSDIYLFAGDDTGLGISATSAILLGGRFVGVLGIDYSLRAINKWLQVRSAEMAMTSAFLVERHTGYLVGSSTGEIITDVASSALSHPNVLVRTAAQWLQAYNFSAPALLRLSTVDVPQSEVLDSLEMSGMHADDTIMRLHLSALNVEGYAVKNLQWVLVKAELRHETCATAYDNSGGVMVPSHDMLTCACRPGYRHSITQQPSRCVKCGTTDPLCPGIHCVACYGGNALLAASGFYFHNHQIFNCGKKRCKGPAIDVGDLANRSSEVAPAAVATACVRW